MTFHVTAIRPSEEWMPSIESYVALAESLHYDSEQCEDVDFAECVLRDADIEVAVRMLVNLRKDGWRLVRDPGGTAELGL